MEHVLDEDLPRRAVTRPRDGRVRLADIDDPADLRPLAIADLGALADEIRSYLVEVAATKGGHFAPSLGVVELTLALHHVFDTPRDLLVWDVGHQAYVHKILTGRRDQFPTIRQYHGLSGFLKRSESIYDTFGAGHASTAPSAALGMATARDLKHERRRVIAVVGDGAMTGGLAFEALNNAGMSGRDFIVVLNDNAMSISPNVGAVAHYLTTLTTHPYYRRMKEEIRTVLQKLPTVGPPVGEFAKRLERGIKSTLVPGALFQSLGFEYHGPIDGHDLDELVAVMKKIKDGVSGPVLLHVLTHKGKGYAPAEADPLKWHGVTPFDPTTGQTHAAPASAPKGLSFTQAFSDAIVDLAERRPDIVAITAAMGPGTGLTQFEERFPDRYFDVGIAEGHGVTFAAGLATQGIRPICAIYSTFLQRAFDHLVHDVAIQHLPVIFALDRGGLVGADGPTHHGTLDLAYLRLVPGMVVSAPHDADELADLLETAAHHTAGPFAIRYPREDSPQPRTRAPRVLPIGSWEVLERGDDVVILAVGPMLQVAARAAGLLRTQGRSVAVVNARFIKPLDLGVLTDIGARAKLVLTLEEGTLRGGFGSAVHEAIVEHDIPWRAQLMHRGLPDEWVTHGSRQQLLTEVGLTPEKIATDVVERLNR